MSKKNTIAGVVLVVACVLCVWYVSLPDTEEFSREGTITALGDGVVISGDDGIVYIPSSSVPEGLAVGTRVSFTAVLNNSQGDVRWGPYKPVDIRDISHV
ncbi:MAG: hypothetical protein O0X93_03275 [Methanocorpusculum sp.]|nr:hypothetical protein [Methanocorpusculum sp.]MDE2522168.1 hypothetical protein [Methanocorpusculum sp.]MDE2525313.1 hypothetical protein [Methanocorpusculum sp.]